MEPLTILLVHNSYSQPGGEDQVFHAEARLLREHGHRVVEYLRTNKELEEVPAALAAVETLWSRRSAQELKNLLHRTKPDVVHFHNTFVRISPAAYYACDRLGIPVVQTLHNYRLTCPAATHLRNGKPCEDCLGLRFAWPAILHRCYRGSASQSGVTATMLAMHRALGTWHSRVDRYIAMTAFMRDVMVKGGIPAARIAVKPNFLSVDPGAGRRSGNYVLFVGRLSREKGIETLLRAWKVNDLPKLKIVGEGPLKDRLHNMVQDHPDRPIEFLGSLPHPQVIDMMKEAMLLVFPSEWYEGFPMALLEAAACSTPIIAARLGSTAEIVKDGRTGLLFTPGDAVELRKLLQWSHKNPERLIKLGAAGRKNFLENYTAARNYEQLLEIYRQAVTTRINQRVRS